MSALPMRVQGAVDLPTVLAPWLTRRSLGPKRL
jgi:hypothetical protein